MEQNAIALMVIIFMKIFKFNQLNNINARSIAKLAYQIRNVLVFKII